MVASAFSIRIPGLVQFAKDLRDIDPALQKELRKANLDAATAVKNAAVKRADAIGGVTALGAQSLRALGAQREGSIRLGGKTRAGRVALGAEYGSLRYHQFKPWRGNGADAGYFMWPSVRATADDVALQYGHAFETVSNKAFPEGRPAHVPNSS